MRAYVNYLFTYMYVYAAFMYECIYACMSSLDETAIFVKSDDRFRGNNKVHGLSAFVNTCIAGFS
jgi:hypothetical protein